MFLFKVYLGACNSYLLYILKNHPLQVSFANAKGNAHTLIDGETDGSILRWGEPRSGDSTYSREGQ